MSGGAVKVHEAQLGHTPEIGIEGPERGLMPACDSRDQQIQDAETLAGGNRSAQRSAG
jgi:hypothetical protein